MEKFKNKSFKRGFIQGFLLAAVLFLTGILFNQAYGQEDYKIISGSYNESPIEGTVEVSSTDSTFTIFMDEYFGNTHKILYTEETCETYYYITDEGGVVINFVPAYGLLIYHGWDGNNEVLIEAKKK